MAPEDQGPVPLSLYRNWPGIDSPGDVRVNRTQLKAIARRLEGHLEDILNAHEDLKSAPQSAYGEWDAAKQLYPSVMAGHHTLMEQHSRFLHAIMDMIKKLHRTAQVYDETEAKLERRIAAIDKHMKVTPTSDLSEHDSPGARPPKPSMATPNSLNPQGGN